MPLGVAGWERMGGKRKRTRPVHYETYDDQSGTCSICLEVIKSHRVLLETECLHAFHFGCLRRYALSRLRDGRHDVPCPMCRAPLVRKFLGTPAAEIRGLGADCEGALLYTFGDVYGNAWLYAMLGGTSGTFYTPKVVCTDTPEDEPVPYIASHLVQKNVFGGWQVRHDDDHPPSPLEELER